MPQTTIAVPPSISEDEAKTYLAMKLFEVGRLSCGQAAELARYPKRDSPGANHDDRKF